MFSSLLGILDAKTSSDKRSMLSSLLGSLKKSSNKNSNDKRSNEKRGKCTFSCTGSLNTHIFPFVMVFFFFLCLPVSRDVNFFLFFLGEFKTCF